MFIWEKFSFFPLLNFWGPPDKGKSSLARQIMYCFGKQDNSTNLGSSTKASLERRAMQKVNAMQHNEEYLNSNHPDTFIFLKDAWDGGNRQKADKDSQGYYSHITHHFLKYREHVERDFISTHEIIKKRVIKAVKKYNPSPRLLDNHIIPLTTAFIIGSHTVLGFKYDDLEAAMIDLLKSKCQEKSNESDTGLFWDLIQESMSKVISNNRHFLVKDELEITISLDRKEAEKEGSNTKLIVLGKIEKVL